jgi:PAS domain S-box-containing protein
MDTRYIVCKLGRVTGLAQHQRVVGFAITNPHSGAEPLEKFSALAASEQTLRAILHNTVEGIWIVDLAGGTVFANARMADLLGVSQASMAQQSIDVLLPGTGALGAVPGARRHYELPFARSDGGSHWLRINAVPRYDLTGNHSGTILLCTDISELRAAEDTMWPARVLDGDEQRSGAVATSASPSVAALMSSFSARERLIVARLLNGDRVPAIAHALFVSQSTVRNQLASVFRKTGVRSQQELIVRLRRPSLGDSHR